MKKIGNKKTLQSLIESFVADDQKQPDEFTAQDFYNESIASGKNISMSGVRALLQRMEEAGKVKSRKGKINGRSGNFYSIVK